MWVSPIGLILSLVSCAPFETSPDRDEATQSPASTNGVIPSLLDQGVTKEQILGVDRQGIPLVCGTAPATSKSRVQGLAAGNRSLPSARRAWECVPSVILADGIDQFYLEVDANGPVLGVSLRALYFGLLPPSSGPIALHDDGVAGDRIAGDFVFTAGPFRYDTSWALPANYRSDPDSPAGLHIQTVGDVIVQELTGTQSQFLIQAQVGVLRSDIPMAVVTSPAPNLQISPHLINVQTDLRATQCLLRGGYCGIENLTNSIYAVFPDVIDEFIFFSTYHLEDVPRTNANNYSIGVHSLIRADWTGSGIPVHDTSQQYGSNGVLLGFNALDILGRGVFSNNITHELSHTWAAYLNPVLGLSDGTHYKAFCSAASLLGGFEWTDNGIGAFLLDCNEGHNGATQAPPIDRYLAGFVTGDTVTQLYNNPVLTNSNCGGLVVSALDVTMEQIQAIHGARTPGPDMAQHDFRLGFVAESNHRLLTPTEMTYYEILADHYCRPVPATDPPPYHGFNWVSIARYWGDNTTWSSQIVRFADMNADGRIDANDIPGFVSALVTGGAANPGVARAADLNRNGLLDESDLQQFVAVLLAQNIPPGDINGDGHANLADVQSFIAVLMGSDVDAGHLARSDLNHDGVANGDDIGWFVRAVLGP